MWFLALTAAQVFVFINRSLRSHHSWVCLRDALNFSFSLFAAPSHSWASCCVIAWREKRKEMKSKDATKLNMVWFGRAQFSENISSYFDWPWWYRVSNATKTRSNTLHFLGTTITTNNIVIVRQCSSRAINGTPWHSFIVRCIAIGTTKMMIPKMR